MRCKYFIVLMLLLLCISCSQSEEQEEKRSAESTAEQIGHEAAEQIKATINSAEMARKIQEQHNAHMQDVLEQEKVSE